MFKKLATGVAAGALFLSSVIPALAVGAVTISGNNAGSVNTVIAVDKCKQKVTQVNNTSVGVNLTQVGNSGNNTAVANMGGATSITTGAVTNTMIVSVTGGDSTATMPNCCCSGNANNPVTISGNNVGSLNTAVVVNKAKTKATQISLTGAWVNSVALGNSGSNQASLNMGSGQTIVTGPVTNIGSVTVTGGSSTLTP